MSLSHDRDADKELFFKESFDLYFEKIVAYIYNYCRDRENAKNIAQDCFVAFWENIDKVESSRTPLPYLFFIARNMALNHLKHISVTERYNTYCAKREFELRYKALSSSTLDSVMEREVERMVAKSMMQMKPQVRETFHLSRFRNMTNEEVAKHLGISVKTVEYRMASAMRIIKKNLRDFILVVVICLLEIGIYG